MAALECQNCNYFAQSTNSEWGETEHCCFREWGHSDDEVAPCDEPDYDVPNYYG